MSQPSENPPPRLFHPSRALRALLAGAALLCLPAAGVTLGRAAQGHPERLAGAALLLAPCLPAAAALRRRVEVTEEGLRSQTLLGVRSVPWSGVRRVDQTRRSFVIETEAGPISAGWIAARERDRLLRLVLEKGRLTASPERLPWGLRARYVPRRADNHQKR